MKTYIVLAILIMQCFSFSGKAQSISDTSKYLRDSIAAKANFYRNKPLSVLLNDLRIPVIAYLYPSPFTTKKDTIVYQETELYFSDKVLDPMTFLDTTKKNIPFLRIRFSWALNIPKILSQKNGPLFGYEWNPAKAAFFGAEWISEIQYGEF